MAESLPALAGKRRPKNHCQECCNQMLTRLVWAWSRICHQRHWKVDGDGSGRSSTLKKMTDEFLPWASRAVLKAVSSFCGR